MKLTTKKIIAREFIFFISGGISFIIAYGIIFAYNSINNNRIESCKKQTIIVSKNKDSLGRFIKGKYAEQLKFTEIVFSESSNEPVPADIINELSKSVWKTFYEYYLSDSIKIVWDTKWKYKLTPAIINYGIKSPTELEQYILKYFVTKNDSIPYSQLASKLSNLNEKRNRIEYKILSSEDILYYSLIVFAAVLVLLFPTRYLIKAFIWSIKILKMDSTKTRTTD